MQRLSPKRGNVFLYLLLLALVGVLMVFLKKTQSTHRLPHVPGASIQQQSETSPQSDSETFVQFVETI